MDPLAAPLAKWLARFSWVTPNRVTTVAIALAVGSATCFALGLFRVGGLLFILRFFVDCLDGMVARLQSSGSTRGAVLDLAADVGGIALTAAALSWALVNDALVPVPVPLLLLGAMVFYNWVLAQRKHLAAVMGLGDGGHDHDRTVSVSVPGVGAWLVLCRQINMSPVPWAVEAEIAMLGLAPLLLPASWLGAALVLGLCFYLLAGIVNMRRLWRLAALNDELRESGRS